MKSENATRCRICNSPSDPIFELEVLGKYQAEFHQCTKCAFVYIVNPFWLVESFKSELNGLDIGSVDRCLVVADFVDSFVGSANDRNRVFLDWGGGYGLLARLMRDRGLNFESYDPFVSPLFTEPANNQVGNRYELVTLSEVVLHLTDPVEVLREILLTSDLVLFTAVIAPETIPVGWWYLMPETGQHVAIYHVRTLDALAQELGVRITSDGRFFHVLHRNRLGIKRCLIIKYRSLAFAIAWAKATKRTIKRGLGINASLTPGDQAKLINNLRRNEEL